MSNPFSPSRAALLAAFALLQAWPMLAVAQSPPGGPEQERQALVQALQKRFPGTTPNDWAGGAEGLAYRRGGVVEAIPFNAENSTNAADILAIGHKAWERKFRNGKSLAQCFPNGGKRAAAAYPQFDPKSRQVVTLEAAIDRCLVLHGEPALGNRDPSAMAPVVAYLRSLSDGQKLSVRAAAGPAQDALASGRALFRRRMGQQNYACASCHVRYAGENFGAKVLSPVVGQAAAWPRVEPGSRVRTLQMQFQACMKRTGAEPFPLGSDDLNNLEYYVSFLSNGVTLRPMGVHRD